ncbi:hypothetical protein niasHT_025292 [Heterodera trifolii]|uniref:Transcription factor AP-2 C-terminal domain-containing protein n=1 Tax=Heterodera trifolii TaxID=157864 RepID=A0ABD2KA19_9BILA
MAAEDEAKSEQQQKDTDDEQQTKCKKRRIEEEKENLGFPIAQSTPLVLPPPGPSRAIAAQCQPNHRHSPPPTMALPSPIFGHQFTSFVPMPTKNSEPITPTKMKNFANLNAPALEQHNRKDSGMGSDDTSTTATTATTKLSSTSTWITTDVDDETDNTNNLDSSSSSSSSSQSVEELQLQTSPVIVPSLPPPTGTALITTTDQLMPSSSLNLFQSSPVIVPYLPPTDALFTADQLQQQQQQQFHPINNFETYCAVPGRLTLMSNQKKYRVSIGEIQRRLAPPECMNGSILGGILRKAKSKEGGKLLREQLHVYGVELALGRRKQSPLSCFSSLVEQEAVQLATDFRTICQRDYPIQAVATHSLAGVNNVQDAYIRRMELFYAGKFLNRILDLHKSDQSPTTVTEQPKHEPTEQFDADLLNINPEVQAGLAHFSLLTHGFGGPSVQTVLETLISVINECNGVLTRNCQSPINATAAAIVGQQNAVPTVGIWSPFNS